MGEWLWPVIVGAVALIFGGGFGVYARKTHQKVGEMKAQLDQLTAEKEQYEEAIDIVLGPDATLDELDRVSRARSQAAERKRLQGR